MTKLTEHAQRIAEFMRIAGQKIPAAPTIPTSDVRLLRAKMILEEAIETIEALGVGVSVGWSEAEGPFDLDMLNCDFSIRGDANLTEVADGCADISVVTIGTLLACGIADDAVLREVDASNLRKFGPGGYRREDGKWMKPAGWTPPDLARVLVEQVRPTNTGRSE